jgi:hypothetical protein
MITLDFITALFYEVDEQLRTIPKHPEAHLWPSTTVVDRMVSCFHTPCGGMELWSRDRSSAQRQAT